MVEVSQCVGVRVVGAGGVTVCGCEGGGCWRCHSLVCGCEGGGWWRFHSVWM